MSTYEESKAQLWKARDVLRQAYQQINAKTPYDKMGHESELDGLGKQLQGVYQAIDAIEKAHSRGAPPAELKRMMWTTCGSISSLAAALMPFIAVPMAVIAGACAIVGSYSG